MVEEYNPQQNPFSYRDAILSTMYIIMADLVIYGCFVPLVGTYLAGQCSQLLGLSPKLEVVMVIAITFVLMYCSFCGIGEANYWKRLFAFDKFYSYLLQFRDFINLIVIVVCLYGIGQTIIAMVEKDKYMKDQNLSEGAVYVFLKKLCEYLYIDISILASIQPEELQRSSVAEYNRMEHGATYMIFWAMITTSVSKLIYYNTLFTYLRAMEIFVSMRPSFEEDDVCGTRSSTTTFGMPTGPSRLENDFARSVRRPN